MNPSSTPVTGRSELAHAVAEGRPKRVLELLEAGSDSNVVDSDGDTPLTIACQMGKRGIESAKLLLEFGADVDKTERQDKQTALHLAASDLEGEVELVELLISNHADMRATDRHSETPLQLAAGTEGAGARVRLLLHKGMEWYQDYECEIMEASPVMFAAIYAGYVENMAPFLEWGLDIEAVDHEGMTALHHACCAGDIDMVFYLLDNGANDSAHDNQNNEPLDYLIQNDHHELTKLWDARFVRSVVHTPLWLAEWKKHRKVAAILRQNGATGGYPGGNLSSDEEDEE